MLGIGVYLIVTFKNIVSAQVESLGLLQYIRMVYMVRVKMKKKYILSVVLIFFLIISFYRIKEVNKDVPTKVEIEELRLPVTIEMEEATFKLLDYEIEVEEDVITKEDYISTVHLTMDVTSKSKETLNLLRLAERIELLNYGKKALGLPKNLERVDFRYFLEAGKNRTLSFPYIVEYDIRDYEGSMDVDLTFLISPILYKDKYEAKLNELIDYYQVIPIEVDHAKSKF